MQDIGIRVTQDISLIEKKIVINALNVYFGKKRFKEDRNLISRTEIRKIENPDLSMYSRECDLYYSLIRVSNDMNSSENYQVNKMEATAGVREPYCQGINNNMLLRCSRAEDYIQNGFIPYHAFIIKYEAIQRAINDLSFYDFMILYIWYFEHTELIYPDAPEKEIKRLKSEYNRLLSNRESGNRKKYIQAWRKKDKALDLLRLKIIDILNIYGTI